jgi:hypothetical protein
MFGLADRLHKTVEEIEALSDDELVSWAAYFKIIHEKAKQ